MQKQALYLGMTESAASLLEGMEGFFPSEVMTH